MPYSKKDAKIHAQQKVKELTQKLEQGVAELFESGDFRKYLSMLSLKPFRKYSWNNCMLIMSQCPGASYTAGYKTWEKEFNRHPKKNEKAINILAPSRFVKKQKKKDENGNETDEEEEIEMFGYRSVSVFDVSQTEGDPVPDFDKDLVEDIEDCDVLVDALMKISPVEICFDPRILENSIVSGQKIIIKSTVHDQQLIKELVTAVSMTGLNDTDHERNRAVAEGITYIVCENYGIDTADQTFVNLAAYGKNKNLKDLKDILKDIRVSSNSMIEKLDMILAE